MKTYYKKRAIHLRQIGYTYSEILTNIPVARSTLSLWLRSVQLARRERQRITDKRMRAVKKGALIRKQQRLTLITTIKAQAKEELNSISNRELWLIGCALYWAEGSKEKITGKSQPIIFSNSDPRMIRVFMKWLKEIFKISDEDLIFEIYIHDTHRDKIKATQGYWSKQTGYFISKFDRIYFKHGNIATKRTNSGDHYYGLLRIRVRKSINLNRKIAGWVDAIVDHCGVV